MFLLYFVHIFTNTIFCCILFMKITFWRVIMIDFLPHILGAIALIIWVISLQSSKKYTMLFLQLISNVFYGIQYVLWGLFSAASMNLVSIVRCYIFGQNSRKNKETPIFLLGVFVAIIIFFSFYKLSYFFGLDSHFCSTFIYSFFLAEKYKSNLCLLFNCFYLSCPL